MVFLDPRFYLSIDISSEIIYKIYLCIGCSFCLEYFSDNYIGKLKKQVNMNPYYNISIVGEGDKIITQSPNPGEIIEEGNTVYLYTD